MLFKYTELLDGNNRSVYESRNERRAVQAPRNWFKAKLL